MKKLARFKPLWIEEPTSPDDVNAHAKISKVIVFSSH
jgi:L-fuconate dehydratase